MAEENSGFFSRALQQLFGDDGSEMLPGRAGEAADDITLRKQWRKKKVDAISNGEDFPSFSEFKAQQGGS